LSAGWGAIFLKANGKEIAGRERRGKSDRGDQGGRKEKGGTRKNVTGTSKGELPGEKGKKIIFFLFK